MSGEGYIGPNASLVLATGAGNLRIAYGQHTTATASDTVVTGLSKVLTAVVQFDGAPVIGANHVRAALGDQAGTPASGSILIVSSKPTAVDNATPTAATTFSIKTNWFAVGY
jgi:hypothetical protein